jgi:putative ABC transport system permease protein
MIKNYFKIAWRNLTKNKVYAFINIAGLALSLTCGIVIFMLIKHHLSFDNFHANPNRIYRIVTEKHRETIGYDRAVPAPLGQVFRNDYTFGEKIARVATFRDCLISIENEREPKKFKEEHGLAFAEPQFFEIFNFPLLEGDKKMVFNNPNAAILTENMAKKYFGSENPIGKTIWLDNKVAFQITGILKNLPQNTDIQTEIFASYASLKTFNDWLASDNSWGGIDDAMQCFTLLQSNVKAAQVEEVLQPYVKKYRPNSKNVHHYKLQPLADVHFDARYGGVMGKRNLWTLAIIGLFLVFTACVNFINLATAQALKRSKEVGVRKVLGSLKRQLFWQFISETTLITTLSIAVALITSYLVLPFANNFFKTQMTLNIFTDVGLLLFIIILGIVVTFFAGSYPGFILAGFQPITALKGKLSQQNIGGFNTRRLLIVGQFVISQILIIGMVVIMKQVQYAKEADLGFDKEAITMIPLGIDTTGVKMKTLKNEISQILGVEKITLCTDAPASEDTWNNSIKFDNAPEEVNFKTNMKAADDQYLSTFGLELVAGKNLLPSDTVKGFLVNETLIRKVNLKSPEEAIGKMIAANGGSMVGPIVGVVKDFHDNSFHSDKGAVAIMSNSKAYAHYAIKINLKNAKTTLATIEKTWIKQYPDQIFESKFLDESITKFYESEDRILTLVQLFSFIAIFIGCLGLYGLVSFMVAQKTKEIGIRKVLGGSVSHILWLFGKEFIRLIVIAFLIAAPIGWWLMNYWLQDFKFRIQINAWTFVLAIFSTLLVAALTVGFQAIKAAVANPVKALRTE